MNEIEQVLVFPANLLDDIGYPNGFESKYNPYYKKIFNTINPMFMDRDLAENDPNFKQLIPYQVITRKFGKEFFVYRRGQSGSENRLKKKLSLGIGGHINKKDKVLNDIIKTYEKGRKRELKEEVDIVVNDIYGTPNKIIGVIYDGTSSVGKVHFGIAHLLQLYGNTRVDVNEDCISEHGWMRKENLKDNYLEFENWSQLVINNVLQTES